MTEPTKNPPPKPPAPPSGPRPAAAAPGKAATEPAAPPKKLNPQEQLLEWSKELMAIGGKVPTKNVVDSDLHGKRIQEIAAGLKELAGED